MTQITAHSPAYNAAGTIDLMVTFPDLGEVPFTSTPADNYGIYSRALAGEFGQIAPYVISLHAAKEAKLVQITCDRDAACVADVTAHGRPWQADTKSQTLLGQAITLASAGLPLPAVWRDADNNDMQVLSLYDLLAIAGAMAAQTQAAYAASWARKAAIEAAIDVAQVEAA